MHAKLKSLQIVCVFFEDSLCIDKRKMITNFITCTTNKLFPMYKFYLRKADRILCRSYGGGNLKKENVPATGC